MPPRRNRFKRASKPAPKKGMALVKKQVQVLMKRTAEARPETKYLDLQTPVANMLFGVDTPFQSVINYPAIGTGEGQRLGNKVSNLILHCKGQIRTQSYNITGGDVWVMILANKLNTGPGAYSLASLYKPDINGRINPLCHRDHENRRDWTILKTVKLWIDHDGVLGSTLTSYQNAAKEVNFTCKIPTPMFDGASIIGKAVQIAAFCNQGTNGTFATGFGYEFVLNTRLTYMDA